MRACVQRVSQAWVEVEGEEVGRIGPGLLALLGVAADDSSQDASYLAEKIATLRVFEDEQGKMNLSVQEVGGGVLVVSQFTLLGDCRRGRRPSFTQAAPPEKAQQLYEFFCSELSKHGVPVAQGRFRAHMLVHLVNDGPVTLLLDSKRLF